VGIAAESAANVMSKTGRRAEVYPTEFWFRHGKLHREDGPAITTTIDGKDHYFRDNERVNPDGSPILKMPPIGLPVYPGAGEYTFLLGRVRAEAFTNQVRFDVDPLRYDSGAPPVAVPAFAPQQRRIIEWHQRHSGLVNLSQTLAEPPPPGGYPYQRALLDSMAAQPPAPMTALRESTREREAYLDGERMRLELRNSHRDRLNAFEVRGLPFEPRPYSAESIAEYLRAHGIQAVERVLDQFPEPPSFTVTVDTGDQLHHQPPAPELP
jgi:hypothetical protein